MHIFTKKIKAKHDQMPRDIYFNSLEEAYGNLPVPSDDWAEIKKLLMDKQFFGTYEVQEHIDELENATEIIYQHYKIVAKALNKEQKYG
ncbi:hypothetical protein KAS79_04140 [Candidatus Parcubacteria bacterium]|nr:hypothetical protein [Candidatus Parcubacteria bacterium]